ncbi:MAG: tRNA pseudouridine(55) synthase TruB [Clostridia bacterium]|nr:tRNA pseudouridine(55) synthase TruB [Clostridia bacterium]
MQGFLLINKPKGITSFGAVARIKRLTGEKRVGHTGTLDPMATGVLPIFIGKATALSSYLLDSEKTYFASVLLGKTTDTFDITGKVISESEVNVTNDDILFALSKFKGKIMQKPPMFSAIQKNGVRLYELARRGETLDIPMREVEIFDIKETEKLNEKGEFSFSACVCKGTYIRSLANDIGDVLGCGATLCGLTRTNASGFDIENCVDLNDLTSENISSFILSEETAVSHFKEVFVSEKQAVRFSNGGQLSLDRISADGLTDGEILRVKYNDLFLGLGFVDLENNQLSIKCVINSIK